MMVKVLNERKTENFVRNHFNKYLKNDNFIIEEQSSDNPRINKLLKIASKSGIGKGYPEFIITFKDNSEFIIVIECKADITKHESKTGKNYKDYAVDGVKLYSSYLSKDFDVLSIAVSGQKKSELKTSHFLQLKNTIGIPNIFDNELLPVDNYLQGYQQDERKFKQEYSELLGYSKKLNDHLHSKKVKEDNRSLLISGILMALENKMFKAGYSKETKPQDLAESLVETIKKQLRKSLTEQKTKNLIHVYSFIKTHEILATDNNILKDLIKEIDDNINSFIKTYEYHDVLGQFYIEFLRYANSDKGLGIVLTPPHITDLFSELAFIKKDSIVIDNCTGTGGFLISAMQKMILDAKGDKKRITNIKKNQLLGIEYKTEIFALACSNMYIHGDGKSNILHGNCFDEKIIKTIKNYKPNAGFLNPPYKSNPTDIEELEFISNNLSMLEKGSYCVAIVPMSCALAQQGTRLELKSKLLNQHTLEAVFSMPDELFVNSKVGVITCIIVFKAHQPHQEDYETYFGYWKDDGFFKRKTTGRADYLHKWADIKSEWLKGYKNRNVIPGYSIKKHVKAEDEWCAEAYMETDYSKLEENNFKKIVKDFVSYQFLNEEM